MKLTFQQLDRDLVQAVGQGEAQRGLVERVLEVEVWDDPGLLLAAPGSDDGPDDVDVLVGDGDVERGLAEDVGGVVHDRLDVGVGAAAQHGVGEGREACKRSEVSKLLSIEEDSWIGLRPVIACVKHIGKRDSTSN